MPVLLCRLESVFYEILAPHLFDKLLSRFGESKLSPHRARIEKLVDAPESEEELIELLESILFTLIR
ncbi:MAG: hypothetical protein QNJ72_25680 [Pleurocapsa sp. MO_226.B13]|nr:hypothetical protein [Pleurocapsa sp. MO_226.B13]